MNNDVGDTVQTISCAGRVQEIWFARFHNSETRGSIERPIVDDILGAVVDETTLTLVRNSEHESPTNIQFQERYGPIFCEKHFHNMLNLFL